MGIRRIDLQGHRGARALLPENTIEGFRLAESLGVSTIEIDIGVSADDVPVVCHDAALNPDITRLPDGTWLEHRGILVRAMSLADLRRLDVGRIRPGTNYAARYPTQVSVDGARIPTLRETLAELPKMRFNIELKLDPRHPVRTVTPETMVDLVMLEVDRADAASRVTIQSFDWRPMRMLSARRPDIALSFLTEAHTIAAAPLWWDLPDGGAHDQPASPPRAAREAAGKPATWAPAHAELTEVLVAEAHALGLRVVPWTVNHAADIALLLAYGVDGLITDDPALALNVLRQVGIGVVS